MVIAPLTIFPVAMVAVMARALVAGDLRELFEAPFSALMITFAGYPMAFIVGWLLLRTFPRLVNASFSMTRWQTDGAASRRWKFTATISRASMRQTA